MSNPDGAALPQPSSPPVRTATLVAVFLVSLAGLSFEVSLIRLFSVVLRYHYLFLVVSVAVCGLGLGGLLDFLLFRPLSRRVSSGALMSLAAAAFAVAIAGCVSLLLATSLAAHLRSLAYMSFFCFVPFFFAGVFMSCAFRTHVQAGGRLYFADLCGAALGSLGVIAALQHLGGINTPLVAACAAALASVVAALPERRLLITVPAVILTLALAVLLRANMQRGFLDVPVLPPPRNAAAADAAKPLFRELGDPSVGARIVGTDWNAFARTDVVTNRDAYVVRVRGRILHSADPRLSIIPESEQTREPIFYVYTDGEVPTQLQPFHGDLRDVRWFPWWVNEAGNVCFLGQFAYWRDGVDRALCIGPGGGQDVLLALMNGAAHVDAVEVNPSIPAVVEHSYPFEGRRYRYTNPYAYENVRLFIDEGRNFVRRSRERYDLIYLALPKTATTATASMTPVESYIVTVEAFGDFLDHLTSDGQVAFICQEPALLARSFVTALAALERSGLERAEALRHLAVISAGPLAIGPYRQLLIVSRSAISPERGGSLMATIMSVGVTAGYVPGVYEPQPFAVLVGGGSIEDFSARFNDLYVPPRSRIVANITPCTDDRPFFLDLSRGLPARFRRFLLAVVALTLVIVVGVAVGFGAVLRRRARRTAYLAPAVFSPYFALLGVGFLLVEVCLAQKFTLFLGYPVLSLVVVLFALLLGGGVGSLVSQRCPERRCLVLAGSMGVLIAALLGVAFFALGPVLDAALGRGVLGRSLISIGILFPVGFLMGMPFPSGLRVAGALSRDIVPWAWAINGVASVLGSVLAMTGGKLWGFSATLLLGACAYALAAILAVVGALLLRPEPDPPAVAGP